MTHRTLETDVEQRLRRHEARFTRGRRRVVEVLARADGPRSAAELLGDLGPEVPVSSLYRSLAVLEEAGVVTRHFGAQGVARYELAEWLTGHHHHFVCVDCGAIEDVALPHAYEERVEKLVDEIGSLSSFLPHGHTLEIEGLCSRCA
ncbi:MAG: Fur family transcriptional regulator [Acidimicrobiia bacterium]